MQCSAADSGSNSNRRTHEKHFSLFPAYGTLSLQRGQMFGNTLLIAMQLCENLSGKCLVQSAMASLWITPTRKWISKFCTLGESLLTNSAVCLWSPWLVWSLRRISLCSQSYSFLYTLSFLPFLESKRHGWPINRYFSSLNPSCDSTKTGKSGCTGTMLRLRLNFYLFIL